MIMGKVSEYNIILDNGKVVLIREELEILSKKLREIDVYI
ncbi:hypothetical protein FH5_04142 [Priestia endophytica]|nr:hypothetical protein FH5_04142 [Priestia endophytica]